MKILVAVLVGVSFGLGFFCGTMRFERDYDRIVEKYKRSQEIIGNQNYWMLQKGCLPD